MNVALRAIHEVLAPGSGSEPGRRWCAFVRAATERCNRDEVVDVETVRAALRDSNVGTSAIGWLGNLRTLGVVGADGRWNERRAAEVTTALRLVGDSFVMPASSPTWSAVATLPPGVHRLLRPPPFRQTAGVLLGLIDRSVHRLSLAAPFIDESAVEFLREAVVTAMKRGVRVDVLTSSGYGRVMRPVVDDALGDAACRVNVTELETIISSLGSHAKVLLVDEREAYVGSANLTGAGLGRHVEIGVELSGPQVEDLARLLTALERLGRSVFNVADGRLVD